VTNAHVVAGTTSITVQRPGAAPVATTPVLFDPAFDLAVLRPVQPLGARPLAMDPSDAERGSPAIVLGYPGGGPLTYGGAAIASRFVAEGRDIYDSALTFRTVYQIEAIVQQGDSGGPLVSPTGEVLGVVFSRSASDNHVGYALASPGVLSRVQRAQSSSAPVATGACIA
jgi:S1-C subfamily serine protease